MERYLPTSGVVWGGAGETQGGSIIEAFAEAQGDCT